MTALLTLPPSQVALASAIIVAYVSILAWCLRTETRTTVLGLFLLLAIALSLRVVFLHQFPTGYAEDEIKAFHSAVQQSDRAYKGWVWLGCTLQDESALLHTLFEGLPSRLGVSQFWAIRGYSLIMSCLCVPLAFAVVRRTTAHESSAWFGAMAFVVLPWAILYGRVNQGGEFVFHQLLVYWALITLLMDGRAWLAPLLIGTFGVTLALYSCPPMRIAWHLVAACAVLFGPRRVRRTCAAIALVSLMLFAPMLMWPSCTTSRCGFGQCATFAKGLRQGEITAVRHRLVDLPRCLTESNACENNQSHTIDSAGQHPLWLLGLAAASLLVHSRRWALFLVTATIVTPLPAMISLHGVSVHELLPWLPLIPLAAAVTLDRVPMLPVLRPLLAGALITFLAAWGVPRYFSQGFWTPNGQWVFNWCHRNHGAGTSAEFCEW